ncbi:hypothetical protein OG618_37285 (plasmid) [Kitasatospora sp. NBC_01246]|uniref:hypothetical protein n=1 Tax=Kitasatospora sp. NBC_01246 TaxID=2903570 RepID=UPI002E36E0B0|nr:hypothetical protein [Kitasatospora sp. NBC_01246]
MPTSPLPADHQAPVTLTWRTLSDLSVGCSTRWAVTASWRGMNFTVDAFQLSNARTAWHITRAADPSPFTGYWTCLPGAKDARWGTMAAGRAKAERLMLAHVAARRRVDARAYAARVAAARRPAPAWKSHLADLAGPNERIDFRPLEDDSHSPEALARIAELASQGVTFELVGAE